MVAKKSWDLVSCREGVSTLTNLAISTFPVDETDENKGRGFQTHIFAMTSLRSAARASIDVAAFLVPPANGLGDAGVWVAESGRKDLEAVSTIKKVVTLLESVADRSAHLDSHEEAGKTVAYNLGRLGQAAAAAGGGLPAPLIVRTLANLGDTSAQHGWREAADLVGRALIKVGYGALDGDGIANSLRGELHMGLAELHENMASANWDSETSRLDTNVRALTDRAAKKGQDALELDLIRVISRATKSDLQRDTRRALANAQNLAHRTRKMECPKPVVEACGSQLANLMHESSANPATPPELQEGLQSALAEAIKNAAFTFSREGEPLEQMLTAICDLDQAIGRVAVFALFDDAAQLNSNNLALQQQVVTGFRNDFVRLCP